MLLVLNAVNMGLVGDDYVSVSFHFCPMYVIIKVCIDESRLFRFNV